MPILPDARPSYRLTVVRLEDTEFEPGVVVEVAPVGEPPPFALLPAPNAFEALASPLLEPSLSELPQIQGAPLASAITHDELRDPYALRANAERFVPGNGACEEVGEREAMLRVTNPRWLEHLAPGTTWVFSPTLVPPPRPVGPPRAAPSAGPVPLSQQLVMTPQLQLAIQMLSFDRAALRAYVTGELGKNPALVTPGPWPPSTGDEADVVLERCGEAWRARADLSEFYAVHLSGALERRRDEDATDDAERAQIAQQTSSARWLLRSLNQRARTIERVALAVAERMPDVLERGAPVGKPVGASEVSEAVGMHASTIERVVQGKRVRGPAGVVELASLVRAGR